MDLSRDGKYTRFDVPAALDTIATGINRHGDIAGFYQEDAIGTHGFIAQKIKGRRKALNWWPLRI